jgi:predicted TIM-barrel fold metal-dependent hydrolase
MTIDHRSDPVIVVSSDTHVGPLESTLAEYCPSRYREALADFNVHKDQVRRRIRQEAASRTGELTPQVLGPAMAWNLQTAGHHNCSARLADMDRDGVAAGVIFHGSQNNEGIPFSGLGAVFRGSLPSPEERELDAVGRHMYNEWLADFCAEQPERHIGLCQVPIWDLEASVAEIAWAGDHGLRGVNFPSPSPLLPSYEDRAWEPFFAVCADRGMVLNTHVGSSIDLEPPYRGPGQQSIRFVEQNWLGRRAIWLLTFTGVFDRHPTLKLVITELPGAWFHDTAREMDATFHNPITGATIQAFLKRSPSEYLAENIFMGASYQSRLEAVTAVEKVIDDRIMWGSDYPHIEGTWRYPETEDEPAVTRLSLANTFHGLPEDSIRKMLGLNAIACYGLDVKALGAVAQRVGPQVIDFHQAPDLAAVPTGYVGFGFRTRGAYG